MAHGEHRAFILRLKPGKLDEYIHWHDNIWPELTEELEQSGILEIRSWNVDDMIILTSRVTNDEAWKTLWDSEVHHRWADFMAPLINVRDDGIVDSTDLRQIWHWKAE